MIHKSAIIGENVQLGHNVEIGAYTIIENDVQIENDTIIKSHAIIRSHSKIQANSIIDSFAVIGGDPQDISFDKKKISGVVIGVNTVIREHATVHRATIENSNTLIGNNCYIMAGAHVGHDCILGRNVIFANGVLLGGFATVDDYCFIGGGAALHQFIRIGEHAIIGGHSAITLDIPPYTMAADRATVIGLNLVGLKRAKFLHDTIYELKQYLVKIYNTTGKYSDVATKLLEEGNFHSLETKKFLEFFKKTSKKGIAPLRKGKRKKLI